MKETWRAVPGWGAYQVSNLGRVKRIAFRTPRGRNLPERMLSIHGKGRQVRLCVPHPNNREFSVAYLVLLAFVGEPPTPYGTKTGNSCARHLDDHPANNKLGNLAWGTQTDNMADAVRNGAGFGKFKNPELHAARISKAMKGKPWSKARRAAQNRRRQFV